MKRFLIQLIIVLYVVYKIIKKEVIPKNWQEGKFDFEVKTNDIEPLQKDKKKK